VLRQVGVEKTHRETRPTTQRRKIMRRSLRIAVLAFIVLVGTALMAGAQGAAGIRLNNIDTSHHPEMVLSVSVHDVNGVPIPDLEPRHFEIVEDGRTSVQPDKVETHINPDAPISIALVIDLSGSMKGKPLTEAQTASLDLLDALLNKDNDEDQVAFFGINRPITPDDLTLDEEVEIDFGNDKNKVLNIVNYLAIEGAKPTPLYDALFRVVKISSEQEGRKAIIVISDGIDQVSKLKADDPIVEANRNNIPIFPISLSTNKVDKDFLQRLAVRTGGIYREAPAPEEFSGLFQEVLDQMKLEYALTYRSQLEEDGMPHSILVRVRSPQVQGFDEGKFVFGQPPAEAEGTPPIVIGEAKIAATPLAAGDSETAAAGDKTLQDHIDDLVTFIQDNPLPSALIGLAVILLIILLVLLVAWLRRRGEPEVTYDTFDYDDQPELWDSSPAVGVQAPGGVTTPRGQAVGDVTAAGAASLVSQPQRNPCRGNPAGCGQSLPAA
jgi:Ca-activated chloride channel family protein